MPCQSTFTLDYSKKRHVIWVGVHQYIFEKSNMFNSFLCLQNLFSSNGLVNISASWSSVPTLLIQISPFVGDLLWNGGGHQCALFLHVEPDCWLTWLHSHCHIAMALSWTWFQSHSRWSSSKVFVHNYRWICIRLWRLIMQHYFASLMTMKQVIFPTIDMCQRCSSFSTLHPI